VSHRLPWDKRGSVRLDQMPDTSPETLKGLSDHDLFRFVAGYKPGTDSPRSSVVLAWPWRSASPGAPKGNKNALKHGRYTAQAMEGRREIAALLRAMRALAGSH
jgi:hypothetical protein